MLGGRGQRERAGKGSRSRSLKWELYGAAYAGGSSRLVVSHKA